MRGTPTGSNTNITPAYEVMEVYSSEAQSTLISAVRYRSLVLVPSSKSVQPNDLQIVMETPKSRMRA